MHRYVIRKEDRNQHWAIAHRCREAIREAIELLHPQDKAVEVLIREFRPKRSLAQNNCFHGWMAAIADWWEDASGQRIEPEAWKAWFKREYLGETANQMPDGKIVITLRGTSELTVAEFSDFLNRIDAWAADQPELDLPRGEDWMLAMGAT